MGKLVRSSLKNTHAFLATARLFCTIVKLKRSVEVKKWKAFINWYYCFHGQNQFEGKPPDGRCAEKFYLLAYSLLEAFQKRNVSLNYN